MDSVLFFGCGGCGFQSAALNIPFFGFWMKLWLLWVAGCLVVHLRYRSRPNWSHILWFMVGLVAGAIMLGPLPFFVAWLFWFVTFVQARPRRHQLLPHQRAIFWLSHLLLIGMVVSAAVEVGRDRIYGEERKLRRAGSGHIARWYLLDVGKSGRIPVSRLRELAEDPSPQVRLNALVALGRTPADADRQLLFERHAYDPDPQVSQEAKASLGR